MTQIGLLPSASVQRKPITSVRLTIGSYILVFMLLCLFGFVVPKFDQIFKDFKTDPPVITRLLLSFSRWCVNDYGWVWLLLAPAIIPIGVTRFLWRPRTEHDLLVRTLIGVLIVFGLIVLITVGTVIALFLPMTSLIQSTSSPR